METKYYLLINEERRGPFTKDQLIGAGMAWDTLVWFKGCKDWLEAHEVAELAPLLDDVPPEAPRERSIRVRPWHYSEAQLRGPCNLSVSMYRAVGFLLVVCGVLGLLAWWFDYQSIRQHAVGWNRDMAIFGIIGCGGLAGIFLIVGWIAFLVFLYRAWGTVQDGQTGVSPGTAVVLLFVPVVQFFWYFVAIFGLTVQLNAYAARNRLIAPPAPVMLGLALALYFLLGLIPFVGIIPAALNVFLMPFFIQAVYRTARCFLPENEERNDHPHSAPTSTFKLSALFAMLIAPIGMVIVAYSGFYVYEYWLRYNNETNTMDRIKSGLVRLERDRQQKVGRDHEQRARDAQAQLTRFETLAAASRDRMIRYGLFAAGGLFLCLVALGLSRFAMREPAPRTRER